MASVHVVTQMFAHATTITEIAIVRAQRRAYVTGIMETVIVAWLLRAVVRTIMEVAVPRQVQPSRRASLLGPLNDLQLGVIRRSAGVRLPELSLDPCLVSVAYVAFSVLAADGHRKFPWATIQRPNLRPLPLLL